MYELIQVTENAFYMDCPSKVGFVRTAPAEAVLIDSGSDRDAAKKVKKHLDAMGLCLTAIFNTHSHADHIGGNAHLQNLTGCRVYAQGVEAAFANYPFLEGVSLYGSHPLKEMENKFLLAKESVVLPITQDVLPDGMKVLSLPGHSYDMAGFITKDNVAFIADSVVSEETLAKYQIAFVYDVEKEMRTLEMLQALEADWFVPSHAPATQCIAPLAKMNLVKMTEIADRITDILTDPLTFDDLLAKVFTQFDLSISLQQRMLVGSSVKSYLTYLHQAQRIDMEFADNKMLWRKV